MKLLLKQFALSDCYTLYNNNGLYVWIARLNSSE